MLTPGIPLEMSWLTPDALPSGQSFKQILKATFQQYKKNGWTLTKPLLAPLLKITLGMYACLILNYLFINTMTQEATMLWAAQNLGLMVFGILVITAMTLWPFLAGFWQYIIYFASLNRNATEAFAAQPIQIKSAYKTVIKNNASAYQVLLLAYFITPLLIIAILSIFSWILIIPKLGQDPLAMAASLLIVIILQLLSGVIYLAIVVLFTFIFQSTAFEKLSLNPIPTLLQSVRMVSLRWPTVLGLHIILAVLTTLLVPILISGVFRLVGLSHPLDLLHVWLIHLILQGVAPVGNIASILPPGYIQMFQMLTGNLPFIASGLTDMLIDMLVTALLLPLGTLAFTRLYWDIRFRIQSEAP